MQVSVLIGELIKGGSHSCRRPLCAPPPFHPPPLASRPPWRALPIPPVESRRSRPPQQLSLPLRPPTTTMAPFPSPRWSCGARCCRRATPCAWTHNSWPQLGSQRQQSCRCGSVKVCIFIFFVGMCEMSGLGPFSLLFIVVGRRVGSVHISTLCCSECTAPHRSGCTAPHRSWKPMSDPSPTL